MPIIDLQRRVAEIGRIRLGDQTELANGRTRPRALGRFRFTSAKRNVIETIALEYGGEVQDWSAPSGPQYEVTTDAREIPVVLIPAEIGFSQWLELWDGSGCVRRCDGITEVRGEGTRPCVCATEPGRRACRETTRLSVLLPLFAEFGSWRLESHSFYAAGEMRTAIELALGIASRRGDHFAFATLRVEDRVTRRPGEQPHRFTVPVLDVRIDPTAFAASSGPLTLPGPSEPTRAGLSGTDALALVEYREPSPRIDRGEHGPAPRPLSEEARPRPVVPPPGTPGTADREPADVPASTNTEPLEAFVDRYRVDREGPPTGVDELEFTPSAGPPTTIDDRTRIMRRMFDRMKKEVWPELAQGDRDERRHALAVIETAKRAEGPVTSFADLTADELARVDARLDAIVRGKIVMRPVARGYAVTLVSSGQTVTVTRADNGALEYQVSDHPPYINEGEPF